MAGKCVTPFGWRVLDAVALARAQRCCCTGGCSTLLLHWWVLNAAAALAGAQHCCTGGCLMLLHQWVLGLAAPAGA